MSEVIHAFQIPMPSGADLPTDIQWMPPGTHKVIASKGGKPHEASVVVNEQTARAVQASFEQLKKNHRTKPYLDFNHEDGPAAAIVTGFEWAGDDPERGGVRARVEWTQAGRDALTGRTYQSFSPSFFVGKDGRVSGTGLNTGGLVNRPAFRDITPIVTKEEIMESAEHLKQITELQRELAELKAKLATAEQTITAKTGEITNLTAKLKDSGRRIAQTVVDQAVLAGKIPAANTAIQAKWVDEIAENPSRAELLDALEAKVPTGRVTGGASSVPSASSGSNDHPIVAKANELVAQKGIAFPDAVVLVAAKEPQLYEDYLKSMRGK